MSGCCTSKGRSTVDGLSEGMCGGGGGDGASDDEKEGDTFHIDV